MHHPETAITAPDDSSRFGHEAVMPPGQPQVVLPGPFDAAAGNAALARTDDDRQGKGEIRLLKEYFRRTRQTSDAKRIILRRVRRVPRVRLSA